MIITHKPEVLSPVGNGRMLEAAVRSGADAVYFGAQDFSARRNAENFSELELNEAIAYCHIRGVKAYLTLNILIKDNELSDAFCLAETAYNYGIDGIIIQDIGLAAVLHRLLPELPLHASTQMSVMSPAALALLKEAGFVRVVAAREMSLSELTEFCKEAERLSLEVEVFVHGALCMSVSGQCLLSAFLGSRSGNRGLCAGPCRLPFSVPGGTGYDLSLKDISLLNQLEKLTNIGVCSLKIEGRMKRPEYVAAATAAAREALDYGNVSDKLSDTLLNVFSRSGFTSGYLDGKLGKSMFGIRTKEDSEASNTAFSYLHEFYRGERSSVPLEVTVTAKNGMPLTLLLDDGKNQVTKTGEIPQPAQNKAASVESLKNGIDKFGSTPYYAENIKTELDEGLFVRASELNELRRKLVLKLDEKRAQVYHRQSSAEYSPLPQDMKRKAMKLYARFEESSRIPEKLDSIDALILPLEKDFDVESFKIPVITEIPRGITDESAVRNRLKKVFDKGVETALCGNLSAMKIALDEGFRVIADTGMNIFNSESADAVHIMGAESVILSSEILISDAAALKSPVPKGIVAYGSIPLMLFRNCPLKNGRTCSDCDKKSYITDRLGTKFPVRCRMGFSELYNSVPIWLADRKEELKAVNFAVLYFTTETAKQAETVINAYQHGGAPEQKFTRGLFYRGTI